MQTSICMCIVGRQHSRPKLALPCSPSLPSAVIEKPCCCYDRLPCDMAMLMFMPMRVMMENKSGDACDDGVDRRGEFGAGTSWGPQALHEGPNGSDDACDDCGDS